MTDIKIPLWQRMMARPVLERRQEGKKRSAADRGQGGDIVASIGSNIVANPGQVVGLVSLTDLLKARVINLESERQRERVLPIRIFLPSRFRKNVDAGTKDRS